MYSTSTYTTQIYSLILPIVKQRYSKSGVSRVKHFFFMKTHKSAQNLCWAGIFWSGLATCLLLNIICFPILILVCAVLNCAMALHPCTVPPLVATDSQIQEMEDYILRKYAKIPPERSWTKLQLDVHGRHVTCWSHSFIIQSPSPEARTLLLIHGNAASAVSYAECFDLFSLDFNVVSLDLPGFGRSITDLDSTQSGRRDLAGMGTVFWVEFIAKFLDSQGLPEVTILGHSFGGFISICFAEKYPQRVAGLLLLGCAGIFPCMGKLGSYWAFVFKFSIPQMFRLYLFPVGTCICQSLFWATNCSKETLYWFAVTQNPRGWGDMSIANGISFSCTGAYWKHPAFNSILQITCPILTIYGTEDTIMPMHQGVILKDLYEIPCVGIPDAGHSPIHGIHAVCLSETIRSFLSLHTNRTQKSISTHQNIRWNTFVSTFSTHYTSSVIENLYVNLKLET